MPSDHEVAAQRAAQPHTREPRLTVDLLGFVYADGVKLPVKYVADRDALQFVDKDRRSISRRGTRFVEVPMGVMVRLGQEGKPDER